MRPAAGRLLALAGLLLLASCGGPTGQPNSATLPAGAEARDSVKASLTDAAPDAADTGTPAPETGAAEQPAATPAATPK